jgi:hypothetical protein
MCTKVTRYLHSRWETFIDGHPAASVFHGKPFLQALQITYGYSPVAVYINPEFRTMQLINRRNKPHDHS